MDVEGRNVIVTGAGSGLGLATAKKLGNLGARLWLIDLNQKALDLVNIEGAVRLALDVSDGDAVGGALAKATEDHGPPSVLINCAGIAPAKKIAGSKGPMPLKAFEDVIRVNLIGSFNCLRLAASAMTANGPNQAGERGVIINTSSVAAYEGQIGQAAYASSKGAITSLTLPAARELAVHGIRVAAIAPGLFGTPLLLNMPQPVQDSLAATVPFPKRFGEPEEFASLAAHIIANPMINGEVIRLDGALRMAAS